MTIPLTLLTWEVRLGHDPASGATTTTASTSIVAQLTSATSAGASPSRSSSMTLSPAFNGGSTPMERGGPSVVDEPSLVVPAHLAALIGPHVLRRFDRAESGSAAFASRRRAVWSSCHGGARPTGGYISFVVAFTRGT